MERITKDEERKLLCLYLTDKENNVFPFLYEALNWRHNSWQEISPEQVWQEAILFSNELLTISVPKFELPPIIEKLKGHVANERNADFLIMFASIYRLLPLTPNNDTIKNATAILVKCIIANPMYEAMKQKVSVSENDKDLAQYRFEILDYHLQQCDNDRNSNLEKIQLIHQLVDTAIPFGTDRIPIVEQLLSRFNDINGHIYDAELTRLREVLNKKVAKSAEPQRIGQIINQQNNIGNCGIEPLLQSEEMKKLLE